MKLDSYLTVLAVAAFGLFTLFVSGCHKDPFGGDNPNLKAEEDLLIVNIPSFQNYIREGAEDPALQVSEVYFLFFDGNQPSSKLEKLFVSQKSNEIDQGNFSLRLVKDNYYLLVVTSPTQSLKDNFMIGKTLQDIDTCYHRVSLYHRVLHEGSQSSKSYFPIVMTNTQGLVPVTEANFGSSPKEPLSVDVELSQARMLINNYPTFASHIKDLAGKYTLTTRGYLTKVFLTRRMALLSNGLQEVQGDGSDIADRYAYSFGYKEVENAQSTEEIQSFMEKNRPWNQMELPELRFWLSKDATPEEKMTYPASYRPEHTVPNTKLLRTLTPHLVLVYRLCPSSISPAENEGWISYQKSFYLLESDFRKVLEAQKKGSSVNVPATNGFPASFFEETKALLQANGNDVNKVLEYAFTKQDLRFYKNSYNYYMFPVRHFDDKQAPDIHSYGRYGVVRGNEYSFDITGMIKDFGETSDKEFYQDYSELQEEEPIQFTLKVVPIHKRPTQTIAF